MYGSHYVNILVTDLLGGCSFLLPQVLMRIIIASLGFIYLREIFVIFVFLVILPMNVVIFFQFRNTNSGINMVSSSMCSIFFPVIIPEDPSSKERNKFKSSVDADVMKKLSTTLSSASLFVFVCLSYLTFFAVTNEWLQTDPDILWTQEQYQFVMVNVVPPLLLVCCLTTMWFLLSYNKKLSKKILSCAKKLVDILFIITVIVISAFSYKLFPSDPHAFVTPAI